MSEFTDRLYQLFFQSEFHRSKRGNFWRKYEEQTLTVFQHDHGTYGWCIAGEYGPTYSAYEFDTELEALDSLQIEVEFNETFTLNFPKETMRCRSTDQ